MFLVVFANKFRNLFPIEQEVGAKLENLRSLEKIH